LSSDKRDTVIEYLAPLKTVVKVDVLKDKLKPLVLKIEKLHLHDQWLNCKIKLYSASKKLQLETIPKKLQLKLQPSPELLEALVQKKETCRARLSVILAYFRRDGPNSSSGPAEWVSVPSAPKFEGS